jgi:hypothetical protein
MTSAGHATEGTMTDTDTATDRHAVYRTWHQASLAKQIAGDVGAYMAWAVENPSPIGGLFGGKLTPAEIIRGVVETVATAFTGTQVELRFSDTPEASSKLVYTVRGRIAGRGFVCQGAEQMAAIALQNEDGVFLTIPVRQVVDIENA